MARPKKVKEVTESKPCEDCNTNVVAWRCGKNFSHTVCCEKCHVTRYPNHEVL